MTSATSITAAVEMEVNVAPAQANVAAIVNGKTAAEVEQNAAFPAEMTVILTSVCPTLLSHAR